MIAITFALPAESSCFLRYLGQKEGRNENGVSTVRGRIDNAIIEVVHTGVGETICRERTARFLQDRQPQYLISSGFSGALTNQLHACEVFIAQNFSTLPLDFARTALPRSSGPFCRSLHGAVVNRLG